MRTIAEVLQVGLDNSSLEQSSHKRGMCYILSMCRRAGLISLSECHMTLHWLDRASGDWGTHAYLVNWIAEMHEPTVLSDEGLFQRWCQWYVDKINEFNRGESQCQPKKPVS